MTENVDESTPLTTSSQSNLRHEHDVGNSSPDKRPSTERSFTSKFVESVIIIVAYGTQGAMSALTGPTLPDLKLLTNAKTEAISQVITGDFAGQLISCAFVAFLLRRVSYTLILFVALGFMAVLMVIIPWCPNVPSMIAVFVVRGFCSGFVATALNAALIWIWMLNNGPYMQALHLSMAVGALCSPLIARPFLSTAITDGASGSNATQVPDSHTCANMTLIYLNTPKEPQEQYSTSRVYIPYVIFAAFNLVFAIVFFIRFVFLKETRVTRHLPQPQASTSTGETRTIWFYLSRGGPAFYIFLHSVVLVGFSGFLSLFVVQYLQWSAPDGALLSTVFWTGLSLGRGIGVFGLKVWTPAKFMIFLSVIALIFLLLLSVLNPLTSSIVWASVPLVGFGIGPLAPGILSWYTQQVSRVTSLMAALLLGSTSLGSVVSPLILGYLFSEASPMWLCYLICGVHAISLIYFILLTIASHVWNRGQGGYTVMHERSLEYEAVISEDTVTGHQ